MVTKGFILRENRGIPYYSCLAFESLPWLRHGFSTRRGGAGEGRLNLHYIGGDTREVNENRRRLLSALGLENAALIAIDQIHSNHVCAVEPAVGLHDSRLSFFLIPSPGSIEIRQAEINKREGDALVTNVANAALAIKTADCFSILIVDPVHMAVGAVHSGWRGTLAGVLPSAIDEMSRRFQSDPARILFALGPGIRECCFETGEDVAKLFAESYPGETVSRPHPSLSGKYFVNLAYVLKAQMTQSGALLENQHDLGICTRCNARDFFSRRAEGALAGRMMSVIAIVPH